MRHIVNIRHTLVIVIFATVVLFPLFARNLSLGVQQAETIEKMEQRKMSRLPALSIWKLRYRDIKRLPDHLDEYLTDSFPFRFEIISMLGDIEGAFFAHRNSHGIYGKEGWLFFNAPGPGNRTVDAYIFESRLTKEEFLERFEKLNIRREQLAEIGVIYYFFIAPNKVTICDEFLPDALQTGKSISYRGAFMRYYREHIKENSLPDFIIDPAQDLLNAKGLSLLYYPHDTHWTWTGRIIGARIISDRIRRDFPELGTIPDLVMRRQEKPLTDLSGILNITPPPDSATGIIEEPEKSQWDSIDVFADGQKLPMPFAVDPLSQYYYVNTDPTTTLNAYIAGDSFFAHFHPMPEAFVFSRVLFQPHYTIKRALSMQQQQWTLFPNSKPDIFIEELVERNLTVVDFVE